MGELVWTRPAGFLALVLPLFVWLTARLRARPLPQPTGAILLWRGAAARSSGQASRRRLPPAVWVLLLGLVSGALALAGPRWVRGAGARTFRVLLDRSPSMYLAHTREDGAPSGIGTRLDAGLARLAAWRAAEPGTVHLVWLTGAGDAHTGDGPPVAWRSAPKVPEPPPEFARSATADVLWVTDSLPPLLLEWSARAGGVFAAGGGPVPGAISGFGDERLVWDGAEVEAVSIQGAAQPRVAVRGTLAPTLAELVSLWAEERGLAVGGEEGAGTLLRLVAVAGEPVAARVGRDGWSAEAEVSAVPVERAGRPLATWLTARVDDGALLAVVTSEPGTVHVGLAALTDLDGDPAAFAVSWAELLDSARLAPADVAALEDRRAIDEDAALVRPPARQAGRQSAPDAPPVQGWLAIAAAVCAALALVLRGGSLR